MLAAPVSAEGRLIQYIGRLNRDYEGKEAVYVYDYIDAHMRKFNKMYGKRLRTYKKTGFSVWTGDLQEKQVVHAIFDSGNYTEKFEQDLVEAEKSIVISSPNIRQEKIDRLIDLVKERQEHGVSVTVITTDPEKVVYGSADLCYELIREMQEVAINVVTKEEVEERFAVIDDELVWHGGMNLLGKEDAWDNLMRREMQEVAINVVTKEEVEERFAVIDDELVWHGGMNLLGKEDAWDNLMRIKNHQVAAELLEIAMGIIE